jgi:hypothetical protein
MRRKPSHDCQTIRLTGSEEGMGGEGRDERERRGRATRRSKGKIAEQ